MLQTIQLGIAGSILSSTALSKAHEMERSLSDTIGQYLATRLEALEEKVKLLNAVETALDNERIEINLEKRDLQLQRALQSYNLPSR